MPRGSKPGERRGGRKPGVPNKLSGTVKESVVEVFKAIGGVKSMTSWAKANETEFYRLYSKLLPIEGPGTEGEHLHKIIHEVVRPKG